MNRTEVLNLVARITGGRRYLEIGIFDPAHNFDHVRCPEKTGVDPNVDDHRIVKATSDAFFERTDPGELWDLIFIDGDHRREQVERDLVNALKHLADGGVVAMHDVDPATAEMAAPEKPHSTASWCGEAWKVFVAGRERTSLRAATVDCDLGIGLIVRGRGSDPPRLDGRRDFRWLRSHRQEALGLIPAEETAIRRFLKRSSIVYYTSNTASRPVLTTCFEKLRRHGEDRELVVVSQQPNEMYSRADRLEIVGTGELSYQGLYSQALTGVELARCDTVFLVEDDVLYPEGYFDFVPANRFRFHYNTHLFIMNHHGFMATDHAFTSNCCGDRELTAHAIRQRLRVLRAGREIEWAEPGVGGHDDFTFERRESRFPVVDVRHGANLTGNRVSDEYLDRIDYWGEHRRLAVALGL